MTLKSAFKYALLSSLGAFFALIGLCVARVASEGWNRLLYHFVARQTSLRFPYERVIGSMSSLDWHIALIWIAAMTPIAGICWFCISFLGGALTHTVPVALMSFLSMLLISHLVASVGLLHWPVIVTTVFLLAVLFVLITKLFGYHRPGTWVAEKGKWLKDKVLEPSAWTVFAGFFLWPTALLLFWQVAPTFHQKLLHGAGPWLVRWVCEPVVGAIAYVVMSFYHAFWG